MTTAEFIAEYKQLAHAIQTGVMYEQTAGSADGAPKHLRTGLNCVMADVGSLGRLFIAKGLITEQEYFDTILDGLRREVATYEQRIKNRMGGTGATKITLG